MSAPVRIAAAAAYRALDRHGSYAAAARSIGVSAGAFRRRFASHPRTTGLPNDGRIAGLHRHGITVAEMHEWYGLPVAFIVSAIRRFEMGV